MKLLSLFACLFAAASVAAWQPPPKPPLTASALQSDIVSSKLYNHANVLQHLSLLSSGKRSHGTKAYNYSVAYFKGLLDLSGFYDTELQLVTSSELAFTQLAFSDSDSTTYTDTDPLHFGPAGLVTAPLLVVDNVGCESASAQISPLRLEITYFNRPITRSVPLTKSSSF